MSWQDHIAFDRCETSPTPEGDSVSRMTPGLTGTYDRELREKAGVGYSPVPPEYMGLEGEYDPCGLARRVARDLDNHSTLSHIETLTLTQKGSTVVFTGRVADNSTLGMIIDLASLVDGTRAVDVNHVTVDLENTMPSHP